MNRTYTVGQAEAAGRLEADLIDAEIERQQSALKAQERRDDLDYRLSRQFGELRYIDVGGSRRQNEEAAFRFFNWFVARLTPADTDVYARSLRFCKEHGLFKALNEGINEQGGALVPPEFDRVVVRLIEKFGVFRQYARIAPMASDVKTQARRTGGLTAVWATEGQTITDSTPSYDNIGLIAKKLAAMVLVTTEISEDSALLVADEIAAEVAQAFAEKEDQAGFNGDGSPTFGNITGVIPKLKGLSGTIANIAGLKVGTGNLFSEFVLQDFLDVAGLLPGYANLFAAWYCHSSFYFTTMLKVSPAAGGLTARDGSGRPVFLGYPVNFTQVMPRVDANSQIAALFGDLRLAAVLGDRRNRTLFADPFSLSATGNIRMRATERVDIVIGDVGNASATPADRVAGPIVGLISAAS